MSIYRRALKLNRSEFISARTRRRDFIELAGIYGLILLVIWTPRPWQWGMWALASITILAVIAISWDGWRPMGICRQNFCRSLWAVAVAAALSFGAVVLAERLHTLHLPNSPFVFIRHYGWYAIWAGIQQLMLQCFFLSRSLRLIPNGTAAAGFSACLFAIAHLPNPVLTVITLVFGLAACLIFLQYRNLWPLAMAHAILGIAIAITIPVDLDHNMRVGISYLTYVNRAVLSDAVAPAKPSAHWAQPTGQ